MAYVKVTDGAVTRFLNMNDPISKRTYKELINNNTGYNVVVDSTGAPKEFTEEAVKKNIEKTLESNGRKITKVQVQSNRAVLDED